MARTFDAIDDMLYTDSPPVTAPPFSVSLWFYPETDSRSDSIWSIGDKDTFNQAYFAQAFGTGVGDPIRYVSRNGGSLDILDTTTGWTANAWNHCMSVERASNDRSAWCNGTGKISGTANIVPTGSDRLTLGAAVEIGSADLFDGRLAECAIWNAALTDAEVLTLAGGCSPFLVRRQNLVHYARVLGDTSPEPDSAGSSPLTVVGTTQSAHPNVFLPVKPDPSGHPKFILAGRSTV